MIQGAHVAFGVGTLYQAQEAPEILPAIAAFSEHEYTEYESHNDQ
jgi:hypothetical protein